MKLGISLPNTLTPDLGRGLFLDWARAADQAGFHVFGTIDKPSYDSWDPLIALAAAAAVTERVRLATTVLQLPNRNEVLVAKQAATIDRLSGGRLDLGVGIGGREVDYKVFSARFAGRGKKIERQVRKIRRTWRAAKKTTLEVAVTGPAPLQKPLPPIWFGAHSPAGVARGVELGDSFIIGTRGLDDVRTMTADIKAQAEAAGKKKFEVGALAYCAVGDDAATALEEASVAYKRYYAITDDSDFSHKIHAGPIETLEQTVAAYAETGLDRLILVPLIGDVKQVELIGDRILPAYRVPGR